MTKWFDKIKKRKERSYVIAMNQCEEVKIDVYAIRLIRTRPDTRHKMRLVCVLFTFENNTGPTYGPTDRRTDTTSYRDATAHLKRKREEKPEQRDRRVITMNQMGDRG